ncbi:MAG: hypothetical protein LBD29_11535 [Treponema sp.]|jgi:hypothetical protein|nr:hypothetical protein [Treponema sp.]
MKYLIIVFFIVLYGCTNNNKKETSTPVHNSIKPEMAVPDETSSGAEAQKTEEIIHEVPLPNGTIITKDDLAANGYAYRIDSINVYTAPNLSSSYKQITNTEVILFRLEDAADWLYVVSSDFGLIGFIKTRDLSEYSFYGDWNTNSKSGNYYQQLLNQEYTAIMKYPNIKRYGPALIIMADNKSKTWWNTFYGYGRNIKYAFIDFYPTNHFLIYQQQYEGGLYYIYSIHKDEALAQCNSPPVFNNSYTACASFGSVYTEAPSLVLYSVKGSVYTKEKEADVYGALGIVGNVNPLYRLGWAQDREFRIEFEEIGAYILYFEDNQWKERIERIEMEK